MNQPARQRRGGDPRALVVEILAEVEQGAWADRLLVVRESIFEDSRDRRFVHLLVMTTLRWQGALDRVWIPAVKRGPDRLQPVVRAALRLGLVEATVLGRPVAIAVSGAVDAVKRHGGPGAAGLVNAVLRKLLGGAPVRLDEMATIPAWLLDRWRRALGDSRTRELLSAVNRPARPFVVARMDRGGRDAVASLLAQEGVETLPSKLDPWGLRVVSGAPQRTRVFREGRAILVDPGSALVAQLAAPPDGRPALDATAAPGGKLSILAQHARGKLCAMELVAERARRLSNTVRRQAPRDRIQVLRGDATAPPFTRGAFGLVLLDAPCSGTGTLRRRPDRRWRLSPESIYESARAQATQLDALAPLVGSRGVLVYSVCSLEPEEGAVQIREFLARNREFRVDDPRPWLADDARRLVAPDSRILFTRPEEGETDGFVAARLIRVR